MRVIHGKHTNGNSYYHGLLVDCCSAHGEGIHDGMNVVSGRGNEKVFCVRPFICFSFIHFFFASSAAFFYLFFSPARCSVLKDDRCRTSSFKHRAIDAATFCLFGKQ